MGAMQPTAWAVVHVWKQAMLPTKTTDSGLMDRTDGKNMYRTDEKKVETWRFVRRKMNQTLHPVPTTMMPH